MLPASDNRDISLLAKDQYMREVRWAKRLTEDEQWELLQKIVCARQESGNVGLVQAAQVARERFVESYQSMVIAIARGFMGWCSSMTLLDLVQEGNIGLLYVLDHADFLGVSDWCAYVSAYIRGAIRRAVNERDGMVRISKKVLPELWEVKRIQRFWLEQFGCVPTCAEIASEVGKSEERVYELMEYIRRSSVESLQALFDDGDEESCLPCSDELESTFEQRRYEVVHDAVALLPPRQSEVIRLRYGLGMGRCHTIAEAQEVLGVCIGSAEWRAKLRLRQLLTPLVVGSQDELSA